MLVFPENFTNVLNERFLLVTSRNVRFAMDVFILTHLRAAFHVYTHWIQKMKGFCNV